MLNVNMLSMLQVSHYFGCGEALVHCCESKKLEYWYVAVDLGAVSLRHTLSDPDDVATFLLLQLDERVEDTEVELLHERILHQLHLREETLFVSVNDMHGWAT